MRKRVEYSKHESRNSKQFRNSTDSNGQSGSSHRQSHSKSEDRNPKQIRSPKEQFRRKSEARIAAIEPPLKSRDDNGRGTPLHKRSPPRANRTVRSSRSSRFGHSRPSSIRICFGFRHSIFEFSPRSGNPKFETRNPKQIRSSKEAMVETRHGRIAPTLISPCHRFEFAPFEHSNVFRASGFEFRAYGSPCPPAFTS